MIRVGLLLALGLLAACAAPDQDARITGGSLALEEPAPVIVEEAPVLASPIVPQENCEDPGDGIGGTGCPVD